MSWATLAGAAGEHVKLSVQLTASVDFAVSWLFDRAPGDVFRPWGDGRWWWRQ